jgi:hypothetical protein
MYEHRGQDSSPQSIVFIRKENKRERMKRTAMAPCGSVRIDIEIRKQVFLYNANKKTSQRRNNNDYYNAK